MDGVLVIDKPQGLTSHDVVAAARRLLGEHRIGHTGTLDPLATGVLPLAIGRATRLVRFLAAAEKDYDATLRFGMTTDSYDITGAETSRTGAHPSHGQVVAALDELTGHYMQTPPPYSAKKVEGRRAYQLAREQRPASLPPVPVHVSRAELVEFTGPRARITLTCSPGFYVRSFAHALGALAGTGATLEALRRTRSGEFGIETTVPMEELAAAPDAAARLIPLRALLRRLPGVRLIGRGLTRASHGQTLGPGDYAGSVGEAAPTPTGGEPGPAGWVRLLDADGGLVGLATAGQAPGSLHPSVVLI